MHNAASNTIHVQIKKHFFLEVYKFTNILKLISLSYYFSVYWGGGCMWGGGSPFYVPNQHGHSLNTRLMVLIDLYSDLLKNKYNGNNNQLRTPQNRK